jgi:hypothetical protein
MIKPTTNQLETLRNLAATAESIGLTEAAKAGFVSYSKAKIGNAGQEEVNARIHGIREIIRTAKGSVVADAIA